VLIETRLKEVSDATALSTSGTPQNLAQNWLINLDPYYVCPLDDKLVQRFALAVFYYSTEGDDWAKCSAPTDFTDQAAIDAAVANCPGNPWLMDVSECAWAGAICNSKNETERIDIGAYETLLPSATLPCILF
jgi:hypothetical protein